MEQFWINHYDPYKPNYPSVSENLLETLVEDGYPFVKSIHCLGRYDSDIMLKHDRFRHLEHLSGIADFGRVDGLPDLKHAGGLVRNIEVLFTYK